MRVTQKMHVADMNPKVLAAPTEKEQMPIVYTTQQQMVCINVASTLCEYRAQAQLLRMIYKIMTAQ